MSARFGPWPPAHAVITGGSSGIGLALGRQLAARGAQVSLLARDPARLADAAAQIGPAARTFPVDVRDPAAVRAAAAAAEAAAGPADLIAAGAGAVRPGRFEALPEAVFREQMELNYFGVLNTLHATLPGLRERGRGRVAIIGSAGGLMGIFGYSAYAPTKFALRGLAEALRAECRPDGVLISIAHPPDTETPQLIAERAEQPAETAALARTAGARSADAVAGAILRGLAAGRADIPIGGTAWAMARLAPAVRPWIDRWLDAVAAKARRKS